MTLITIRENSWLARLASLKMRKQKIAMVWGTTIHLHNTSRNEFLRNRRWLRHEVAHVKQYAKFGTARFIFLYLMESFNKGYEFNRFEVEARQMESNPNILDDIDVH